MWKPRAAPHASSCRLLELPGPHPARCRERRQVFYPSQHPQHVGHHPAHPTARAAGLRGHRGLGPSLLQGWEQGGRAGGFSACQVSGHQGISGGRHLRVPSRTLQMRETGALHCLPTSAQRTGGQAGPALPDTGPFPQALGVPSTHSSPANTPTAWLLHRVRPSPGQPVSPPDSAVLSEGAWHAAAGGVPPLRSPVGSDAKVWDRHSHTWPCTVMNPL